jgi:flagellar biosynthesis protein FlhB
MKEENNRMREHDIISAGVKLVGLFILLLGVFTLVRESMSILVPLFDADTRETLAVGWMILVISAFGRLIVSVVQIAFGIYLCRGGKRIVSLLTNKSGDS